MVSKRPAFAWYPKDFETDEAAACMTLAERGAYVTLLGFCWLEGSVPDDLKKLASLCRCSLAEMKRVWPAVSVKFQLTDGRLTNKRIEKQRKELEEWTEKSRVGGKRSQANRNQKPTTLATKGQPPGEQVVEVLSKPKANIAVCSLQLDASYEASSRARETISGKTLEEWTERWYGAWPKKRDKPLVIVSLSRIIEHEKERCKAASVMDSDALFLLIDERLTLYSSSEDATREQSRYCPKLPLWLDDEGYLAVKPQEEQYRYVSIEDAEKLYNPSRYRTADAPDGPTNRASDPDAGDSGRGGKGG